MTDVVQFEELGTPSGLVIGQATLNSPGSLNALSLDMIDLLYDRLVVWQEDAQVAMVILQAAGEKAFCAGGDIRQLYDSIIDTKPAQPNTYAEQFFEREYRLDYLLHTFSKPILCWGHGIVMGGGVGLLAGCSHRVVTESSRIAMPEISIGLFPDVGGSWILNQMPGNTGLFLGLTGVNINAADALFVGMANYFVEQQYKRSALEALISTLWTGSPSANASLLTDVLNRFQQQSASGLPEGQVEPNMSVINQVAAPQSVTAIVERIEALDTDSPWLLKAQSTLAAGSPITMHLVFEQIKRAKGLPLAQVFQMEWLMAVQCTRGHDFSEGVRALLVDKDGKPVWQFNHPGSVPAEVIERHFMADQSGTPLHNLGSN